MPHLVPGGLVALLEGSWVDISRVIYPLTSK